MTTRAARLTRRLLTGALIASTIGLFAATGMFYMAQSQQRQALAASVRTSGWVAYQAQLEYVRTTAAIELARARPTSTTIGGLELRLQLLASRLAVLHDCKQGDALPGLADFKPVLKRHEAQIAAYAGKVDGLAAKPERAAAELAGWSSALYPLGLDLQKILETSIVSTDRGFERETTLAGGSASLPFGLMFLSGAGLVALLGIQAAQDRRRLNDILKARRAQAATESNFRAAIEAMPAAIAIFDPETGAISFVNPAATALLDKSPEHPEWRRLTQAATDGASASGGVNIAFQRAEGAIISLRGTLCDILWEGKPQRLLAVADISKIRDAELQVMQAAKLATLGEMATAIAHETSQPLAVIKMAVANARRLIAAGVVSDALIAKLARIDSQVDRVKAITDQIRRYGRPASRQQEPFAIHDAVSLAIGFVAEQYRASGIRLEIQLDLPPDLLVAGEQTMFEQVIVNILVNARDAFESARLECRNPMVRVRGAVDSGGILISIEDNAGGVRPDILSRLFEPYMTNKPIGKGTGLGLSMSRNIVRDMHGDIVVANVAEGARFQIRLPVASRTENARAAA